MASNLLVTGKWGEVHVTSAQQRNFNSGVVGNGQYVMSGLAATMSDSNTLHVGPGVACMNGADIEVPSGGVDVTVTNGTQGMLRSDLICVRYTMDGPSQKEKAELVCVRGTPAAADPQDPEYNDGSILDGSLVVDMPLYRVPLDGISVGDPEPLFDVLIPMADLRDSISQVHPVGSIMALDKSTSPGAMGIPGRWATVPVMLSPVNATNRYLNIDSSTGFANGSRAQIWDDPTEASQFYLRVSQGDSVRELTVWIRVG